MSTLNADDNNVMIGDSLNAGPNSTADIFTGVTNSQEVFSWKALIKHTIDRLMPSLNQQLSLLSLKPTTTANFFDSRPIEQEKPSPQESSQAIIIVLGWYVTPMATCDLVSRRRVEKALQLIAQDKADRIIFSGGKNAKALGKGSLISEAQAMLDYAINLGLDPSIAYLEEQSTCSWENKRYSEALINQLIDSDRLADRPKQVYVISSDFSLQRLLSIFTEPHYEVIPAFTEPESVAMLPAALFWQLYGKITERIKSRRQYNTSEAYNSTSIAVPSV
ncbi:MAG: YdcF family protein [Leptolyngbya sp. SIO3F4]|nr:YdcF family protein [Leptolyngbya sp. SIO3F4]